MKYNVGLYARLSRDDGDKYESDSITTQCEMLNKFVEQHEDEFIIYKVYKDDGYSGTTYDRPDMNNLIQDIEDKKVNCVIVKDLSRFGRDYIQTGHYLERYFPQKEVRFISINDNIDSAKKQYDVSMPIKNIMNEEYAKDISKKVISSFRTKQQSGAFVGSFATYGYMKDPKDKHKLIIDEYAANIVRRIFSMFINGTTRRQIAFILNKEGILSPSAYKTQSSNYVNGRVYNDKYAWSYTTITTVLTKEIYIGNMVQHVQSNNGLRTKGKKLKKEDYIIVKNTHEPIIDMNTWDKTQTILAQSTRQVLRNSELATLAGFVRCNDCKKSMIRYYGYKTVDGTKIYYYACASYKRYGNAVCSKHAVRYDILEEIVLNELNECNKTIHEYKDFINKNRAKIKNNVNSLQNEIKKSKNELDRISNLKQGLYEDYKERIISKDEYVNFKNDYINKEDIINKNLILLQERLNESQDDKLSSWLEKFAEFGIIENLDRNIMATFVNCIYVLDDNNNLFIDYKFNDDLKHILKDKTIYDISYNN